MLGVYFVILTVGNVVVGASPTNITTRWETLAGAKATVGDRNCGQKDTLVAKLAGEGPTGTKPTIDVTKTTTTKNPHPRTHRDIETANLTNVVAAR